MRGLLTAAQFLVILGVAAACTSSTDDEEAGPDQLIASGSWYVVERWPHDGQPIEGENFVVYSDAAGSEARGEVSARAEEMWAALLDQFSVEPEMLRLPEGQEKLDIYVYREHDPSDWEARAYFGGLIIWSPDHGEREDRGTRFGAVLEHELVHVLQWLLTGPSGESPHAWFLEGLAEVVAGGTTGGVIRGLDQLHDLTGEYGPISPISIEHYSQITSPEAGERFYYPMFHLAVEYLFDDDGYGRSLADARDVFVDMRAGTSFEAAFEDRMGIRLDDYEAEFFDRIEVYLPQYRSLVFSPAGFTAVSALVVLFVIGIPLLGYRRWRLRADTEHVGVRPRGRRARIGFLSGLIVAGSIIIIFFLTVLFVFGTSYELNNEMYSSTRPRAYLTLAGYLFFSVGVLLWALRLWRKGALAAFLAAPLVLLATITAVLVLGRTAV